ncbi:MAG: hypothetical protein M3Y71_18760 [Actinomycetota bacterium]|nr:hypothetical protein [Actinomycetota bacterium]
MLSLARDHIVVYAVPHDGEADDAGFVIGVLFMASGWWGPRITWARTVRA